MISEKTMISPIDNKPYHDYYIVLNDAHAVFLSGNVEG